jgi:hypothetical protein
MNPDDCSNCEFGGDHICCGKLDRPDSEADPTAAPPAPAPVEGLVKRTASGETFMGFPVAAYRETHPEHGDTYGHRYSEHWSTPSKDPRVKVERLFTEDLITALAARLAECERSHADRLAQIRREHAQEIGALRARLAECEARAQQLWTERSQILQDAGSDQFDALKRAEAAEVRLAEVERERDEAREAVATQNGVVVSACKRAATLMTEMERIADLTERWTDSLVSQVNEIARAVLSPEGEG